MRSLDEAALASYLATDEARESFRLSLIADVADAYFPLQEMEERTVLSRATVKSRAENRELVTRRRDAGLAATWITSPPRAHTSPRAPMPANLERSRAAADERARPARGHHAREPPPRRRLTRPRAYRPDLAVDVPSEALLRRPDVRAAEQRLVAANANIGAARAAFLPRVGIGLAAGTASRDALGLFDAGSGAWSFIAQPRAAALRRRDATSRTSTSRRRAR